MEKELVNIELKVLQMTTGEGKKFLTYKALNKNGQWIECKFRKNAGVMPEKPGILTVEKSPEKQYSVEGRNFRKYPRIWIHKIEQFEPFLNGKVIEKQSHEEEMF